MDEEPPEVMSHRLEKAGMIERLPSTDEEANTVESILTSELSGLSLLEHDQGNFDVHGIANEIEETPELIENSLGDLEKELEKIKKKPAYEKAMELNPSYVNDRRLRIMVLRCELFNCKNAANRLALFFEKKAHMFGSGAILGRDIRLSDMDQETIEVIESGAVQVLPNRDVAGRSVLCFIPGNWTKQGRPGNLKAECVPRAMYYSMMTTARDSEETQKKGWVVVIYNVGRKGPPIKLNLIKALYSNRLTVPHRMLGFHQCYDDKALRPLVSGIRYVLDKQARIRCRIHFGDQEKVLFQLQTYGIPIDERSPFILESGSNSLKWHREWLQIRKEQEASATKGAADAKIVFPHRFDVLFGRGKAPREHTGNLRAVHLVNMWHPQYDAAINRFQKTEISERIVKIIHDSGGRFLKWEESEWVEAEDDAAREKISHFFRHQRRRPTNSPNTPSTSIIKRGPPTQFPSSETEHTPQQKVRLR